MTLTDEQVSMLLSEAEAGWPVGRITAMEFVGDVPSNECLALARPDIGRAYSDGGYHRFDRAKGRDAAGRLLVVLVTHGLVRCGECDDGYIENVTTGIRHRCHVCNGTGVAR